MSLHLITGYGGSEHITSADDGSFNAAMFGNGSYVLDRGNKFSASITSNNTVRILDGDIIMQGRHIRLKENSYEDVTIENGTADMKRHDIIAARYAKDGVTGIETCSFAVIKGTPARTASDPACTTGNILNGDVINDMPLYRVKINGIALENIEPLFETTNTFSVVGHTHTKSQITDFPSHLPANGGNADTVDGKHASDLADATEFNNHKDGLVSSTDGIHGFRVNDGLPEYFDGENWQVAGTKDAVKYVAQELTSSQKAQARVNIGVSSVSLKAPTNISALGTNSEVSLTWTDPADAVVDGYTLATWGGTKVVRKIGSAPTDENDGVLVTDEKTRNRYSSEAFVDNTVENNVEYFYGIFPYTTDGVYTYGTSASVIPRLGDVHLWTQTIGMNYSSLDDIPEADMRTLMTKHASCDYLYTWLSDDADAVDDFVANANAMKWIGLRDYICDKLMSVSAIKTKLLASDYWEYILKDHVPIMTSNTAPYGEAIGTDGYYAFDNSSSTSATGTDIGYKFVNPTKVMRVVGSPANATLQCSDGSDTWNNDDGGYHLMWRIHSASSMSVQSLQFYGRALDTLETSAPTDGRAYKQIGDVYYTVDWTERTNRTYLYDHGVEFASIATSGFSFGSDPIAYCEKKTDHLYLEGVYGGETLCSFENPIDLTTHSRVMVDVDTIKFDSYSCEIWVSTGHDIGATSVSFSRNFTVPKGVFSLDVSQTNQSDYVTVCNSQPSKVAKVYEIWLE